MLNHIQGPDLARRVCHFFGLCGCHQVSEALQQAQAELACLRQQVESQERDRLQQEQAWHARLEHQNEKHQQEVAACAHSIPQKVPGSCLCIPSSLTGATSTASSSKPSFMRLPQHCKALHSDMAADDAADVPLPHGALLAVVWCTKIAAERSRCLVEC